MCRMSRRDVCILIGILSLIFFGFRCFMAIITHYLRDYLLYGLVALGVVATACLFVGACKRNQFFIWAWVVLMIPVILSDIVRASLRIVKLSKTDEGMKRIHLEVSEIIFAVVVAALVCVTITYAWQLKKGTATD